MDNTDENLSRAKVFEKAREIIGELEKAEGCNGLLLTYDPEAEKFQFLAMHADADEVFALLLSGMGVVKDAIQNTSEDRTLN